LGCITSNSGACTSHTAQFGHAALATWLLRGACKTRPGQGPKGPVPLPHPESQAVRCGNMQQVPRCNRNVGGRENRKPRARCARQALSSGATRAQGCDISWCTKVRNRVSSKCMQSRHYLPYVPYVACLPHVLYLLYSVHVRYLRYLLYLLSTILTILTIHTTHTILTTLTTTYYYLLLLTILTLPAVLPSRAIAAFTSWSASNAAFTITAHSQGSS
jgi:hypothetical protein